MSNFPFVKYIFFILLSLISSGCASMGIHAFGNTPSTDQKIKAAAIDVATAPVQIPFFLVAGVGGTIEGINEDIGKKGRENIVSGKTSFQELLNIETYHKYQLWGIRELLRENKTISNEQLFKLAHKELDVHGYLGIYNHDNADENTRDFCFKKLVDKGYSFRFKYIPMEQYPAQHISVTSEKLDEMAKMTENLGVAEDVLRNFKCSAGTIKYIYEKMLNNKKYISQYYGHYWNDTTLSYYIAVHPNTSQQLLEELTFELVNYKKSHNSSPRALYGLSKNPNLSDKLARDIIDVICSQKTIGYDNRILENLSGKSTCN